MKSSLFSTFLFSALAASVYGSHGATDLKPYVDYHYRRTDLYPTRHPEHNATDFVHLRPTESLAFHYHDPAVPFHLPRSFATVHVGGFNAPAVNLENSDHIYSVKCDKNNMVVKFNNNEAWDTAAKEWSTPSELVMITFRRECGGGLESGERSYHLVSGMEAQKEKRQISFAMSTISFEEAVHPQKDVTIDIAGYQVDPTSNSQHRHLSHRDGDPATTENDDFDNKLDQTLGYEDLSGGGAGLEDLFGGATSRLLEERDLDKRGFQATCLTVLQPWVFFGMLAWGKDPCPPITKPTFNAIKSAAAAIKKFFTKDLPNIAAKIVEFFQTVAMTVAQILSERGWNPAGTFTFDTNVTKPMETTDEFGSAYKVYTWEDTKEGIKTHSGNATAKAKLDIYCVGCRINGFVQYEAHFKYTLEKLQFTAATMHVKNGMFQFEVGVGVIADITIDGNLAEYNLPEVPLSPLTIPGLITVGPMINSAFGADWELGATGTFVARTGFGWKDMNIYLDLLNAGKSRAEPWTRLDTRPEIAASITGKATLTPYFAVTLDLAVNILKGKLIAGAGLEAKTKTPLSAELKLSTDKGVGTDECAGATVSLDLAIELSLTLKLGKKLTGKPLGSKEFKPLDGIFPLTKCISLPSAKAVAPIVPAPPLPASILAPSVPYLNNATSDITLKKITSAQTPKGRFQLLWLPGDNNLYLIPRDDPALPSSEAMGSMLFVTRKGDNNYATDGSGDGRFFHVYNDITQGKAKASRIRLATKDKVPKGSVIVTLRSDSVDGTPILRAIAANADLDKGIGVFYLVACLYPKKANRLAKAFVVGKDLDAGINELMKSKAGSASDPKALKDIDFDSCFGMPMEFTD
ncbi:hypothetical protein VNI00_010599 [Paramarasmius palmivorus]|uniref:Uncharacterized protein n=1 Tax=Paramarasmius palmivorus TaxID=297713 RepID=A0AAW0CKI4_9AGAR